MESSNSTVPAEHQRRYYAQTASNLTNYIWATIQSTTSRSNFVWRNSFAECQIDPGRRSRDRADDLRRSIAYAGAAVRGVEPVAELREVAYEKGIDPAQLIDGNGAELPFPDQAFDLVCAFAVLHHVPRPERVIAEMLRVARLGIFISDSNNFGQGSSVARAVKQTIRALGLWKLADFVKTGGRGYTISAEDGLAYSYSVFDNLPQLRSACRTLHFLNTRNSGSNLLRTASHVAVLGIK